MQFLIVDSFCNRYEVHQSRDFDNFTVFKPKREHFMFYDYFETGVIGTLTLVGDEEGLRHIDFEKGKNATTILNGWDNKPGFFEPVKTQLKAYFMGELTQFDLQLAPVGTPFQLKVWEALRTIPYGDLASYKTIAEAVGNPKGVRAVGGAIGKNPIPIIVPCHRVIGSDGSLTGFGGGLNTKKRLIELEKYKISKD
jgi:methylated-DNA-[protein]-cysteine S-methyltransferase